MKARDEDLRDLEEANRRFRDETERLRFQYRCDACAHIVPSTNSCSLGYPNDTLIGPIHAIQADGNLTFCKYFELGERVSRGGG
jgi:hypothetical protein